MSTPATDLAGAVCSATPGTAAYYRALAAFARARTFRDDLGHPDRYAIDRCRLRIAGKALIEARFKRTLSETRRCLREADEAISRSDEDLIAAFVTENRELAEQYDRKADEIEAQESASAVAL